jgi:hypothetical protein
MPPLIRLVFNLLPPARSPHLDHADDSVRGIFTASRVFLGHHVVRFPRIQFFPDTIFQGLECGVCGPQGVFSELGEEEGLQRWVDGRRQGQT